MDIKYCFKTQIVDECNLNCRGCDHFSPISDVWHQPLDDFIKMIKTLRKSVGNNIREIELYGGEPLLHEKLYEMLMAVKVMFGKAITISVETNGILLDDFLKKNKRLQCDNTFEYQITEYKPTKGIVNELSNKYPNIHIFETKHTPKELSTNTGIHKDTMFNVNIRKEKLFSNIDNIYHNCYCKAYESNSLCLRNWMISPCPLVMCMDIFDKRFDEHYREEINYVKVSDDLTKDDLYRLANYPCENCKRCGNVVYGFPYEKSKKTRDEWQVNV